VCCESSARDAAVLDFKTFMVSDANAALTDEEHMATLVNFIQNPFGDQMMGLLRATFSYAGFSLVESAFGSVIRTARIQEIQKPRK